MVESGRRSTYNLFVSHSWNASDEYERMIELLENKNRFSFENYSVPSEDPIESSRLEYHLKHKQIKPASVVVVLAGLYSSHSDMIQKEMTMAEDLDKPILGVEPWGSDSTSRKVKRRADEVVGWNAKTVVDQIQSLSP